VCLIRFGYFAEDPRLQKMARTLLDAGYEVHVVSLRESERSWLEGRTGLHVHRLNVTRWRSAPASYVLQYLRFLVAAFFRVRALSRRLRLVAIQTQNVPNVLVFASWPAKRRGARISLDLQEPMPELYADRFGIERRGALWRILMLEERFSCAYADQLTTVSEAVRDLVAARVAHPAPIVVLPNTPDESLFFVDADAADDQLRHEFLVCCHSTLLPRYGLDTLITSVSLLTHLPDVRLEIFGAGDDRARLDALVSRLGLGARVTLRGLHPLGELAGLLRRADVGVVPLARTPFTEIMAPNKLFEYVALGKPVIASRLAGIERYFTDREVLFVEPGDASALAAAIERLYADPALRDQLASRALERFKAYRWSSVVDDYLEALTGRSTG